MYSVTAEIAGITVRFNTAYDAIGKACEMFLSESENPDITIEVSKDELENEIRQYPVEDITEPAEYEITCAFRKLSGELWKYNALLFHSAAFKVDDTAISFSARSGTGKTTHLRLWRRLLGYDRLKAINGDKPFIRFFNDIPYACGSPWMGKEGLGMNAKAPLKHICFIERSETNSVIPLGREEFLNRVFDQVFLPTDPIGTATTLQLIDKLMASCRLWVINCNMDIEAAEVAYNTIFKDEKDAQ